MSKIVAFLYSFLILVQSLNINFEEFSKLQAFMEHADFHKNMYGDTFFEFLSVHYGDKMTEHQNKHKEHQDLPFKDNHQLCIHMNTSYLNQNAITFEIKYEEFSEIPFNFFYKDSLSSFEKPTVFQPPKTA